MPNAHFRAIFEMPEMRNMLSKTKGNEESRVETGASFGNGIIPLHEAKGSRPHVISLISLFLSLMLTRLNG